MRTSFILRLFRTRVRVIHVVPSHYPRGLPDVRLQPHVWSSLLSRRPFCARDFEKRRRETGVTHRGRERDSWVARTVTFLEQHPEKFPFASATPSVPEGQAWNKLATAATPCHFLKDLSTLELSHFVDGLGSRHQTSVPNLQPSLHEESIRRLRHFPKETRLALFQLAHSWLKMGLASHSIGSHWPDITYIREFQSLFLSPNVLKTLSSDEVIYVLFLSSVRRCPELFNDNWSTTGGKISTVPPNLYLKLTQILPDLPLMEVGIVAAAIHMNHLTISSEMKQISEDIFSSLLNVKNGELAQNDSAINVVCKLMKERGNVNFHIMAQIVRKYEVAIVELSANTQIRLMAMLTEGSQRDLERILENFTKSIANNLGDLRMKDIEKLCFILYNVNFRNANLIQKIRESIHQRLPSKNPKSYRCLVYSLLYLSKIGHLDAKTVNRIFEAANQNEKLQIANSNDELAKASLNFLFAMCGVVSWESGSIENELKRSGILYKNLLLSMAHIDCVIDVDYKDYTGVRLNQNLRRKFVELAPKEPPNSYTFQMKESVLSDLKKILGINVYKTKVIPHAPTEEIIFCAPQGSLKAIEIDNGMLESMKGAVVKPESGQGKRWICVLVPKRNNIDGRQNLLGQGSFLRRQLEILGYQVIVINFFSYEREKRRRNSQKFVKRLLSQILD